MENADHSQFTVLKRAQNDITIYKKSQIFIYLPFFLSFNIDPNSYLGMAVDCIRDLPILHQHILFVECRQPQLQVHGSILGALIWIVSPLHMIGYRASMLNMAPIDKPLFNTFILFFLSNIIKSWIFELI